MASEVQICNMALLKYGDHSITSITAPTTTEERACSVLYPLKRDELLYAHPWNFAMTRADITGSITTAPPFPDDWYAYTLPANCLRVWELYDSDEEWIQESGQLLTPQEEEVYIRYLWRVTETGRFNPAFCNCLATLLGAELAAKFMGDAGRTMRRELLAELNNVLLPAAYSLNAMEGNRPRHKNMQELDKGNFSWQSEGR